jgi:hypothetical protein
MMKGEERSTPLWSTGVRLRRFAPFPLSAVPSGKGPHMARLGMAPVSTPVSSLLLRCHSHPL